MKIQASFKAVIVTSLLVGSLQAQTINIEKKQAVVASIERQKPDLIKLSDQIWRQAEVALREHKSSRILADYAEQQGFNVERGVAGMPTAFIATYGQGRPLIGILGEFDALPGISQKATPTKEALESGAAGHGCGHNLFGTASLGAAVAIKELIAAGKLKGTIRFYGTPAEESIYGKVYLARDGFFNDLDVCMDWHPGQFIKAHTQSTQAIVDFIVEFNGVAAHAAGNPWLGRSALDGLEAFTHGVNLLREHVKPSVRMHYIVQKGGDVPNVVPEYAKVWCWVRDSKRTGVDDVLSRLRQIAEGAALVAGVASKFTIQTGCHEVLVNQVGAKVLQENLNWLGPIQHTEAEQEFARTIQRAIGIETKGLNGKVQPLEETRSDPPGGSTDVGDVSWLVPTIRLSATTAVEGGPGHAWPVVACAGMSIGHKGLIHASKSLASTMVDLFEDAKIREAIRAEFKEKTKGFVYKPYIPDGPPPVPR